MPAFHIPVVDVAGARSTDPRTRAEVARAFGDALEQVGFVTVVGHAVDAALMTATYDVLREFFALPTTDKLASCPPEKAKFRGYLPVGIESVAATLTGGLGAGAPIARVARLTQEVGFGVQDETRLRDLVFLQHTSPPIPIILPNPIILIS